MVPQDYNNPAGNHDPFTGIVGLVGRKERHVSSSINIQALAD